MKVARIHKYSKLNIIGADDALEMVVDVIVRFMSLARINTNKSKKQKRFCK